MFDVEAAKQAGYSEDEIIKHLTETRKFDVEGARKAGYSNQDIISHLSTKKPLPTADEAFGPAEAKKAQRETYQQTGEYVPESGLKPGQLSPQEIAEQNRQAKATRGKVVNMGVEALPWLGLAAGAALGTGATPGVGSVAGGGLGYAAGQKAKELIEGKKHTPVSALTSTGKDVLKGGAYEAGGQVIGKVAPMLYKGAKNLISPKTADINDVLGMIREKVPYKPRPSATAGLREGAETEMGKLADIEKQLYDEAAKMTPKDLKVNFEDFNEFMNDFENPKNQVFGRLKPPEKSEIRSAMRQIRNEINTPVRAGMRGRVQIDDEQLADLIERGGFEDVGAITKPGSFEAARATRSWLSEESANAYKAGNKNLGRAYRELCNKLEEDIKSAVGDDAWATWKMADNFKTRNEIIKGIFGTKAEVRPGTYNPKTIEANIKKVPKERLEANFSKDEIQVLNHLGDPGWVAAFQKTHPTVSALIKHIIKWGWVYPAVYETGRAVFRK